MQKPVNVSYGTAHLKVHVQVATPIVNLISFLIYNLISFKAVIISMFLSSEISFACLLVYNSCQTRSKIKIELIVRNLKMFVGPKTLSFAKPSHYVFLHMLC